MGTDGMMARLRWLPMIELEGLVRLMRTAFFVQRHLHFPHDVCFSIGSDLPLELEKVWEQVRMSLSF